MGEPGDVARDQREAVALGDILLVVNRLEVDGALLDRRRFSGKRRGKLGHTSKHESQR